MKIIYLANARIPTEKAHGFQIMKMCEAFKKDGAEIELVVAKRKDNQLESADPFQYYGLREHFSIKKLPLIDLVDRSYSLKGFSVVIQNTSFAISSFFYLIFRKVDIIYSRDEFSLFFLALFRKNLVLELHIFPENKLNLYKFIFKRVKKIIVITQELKKLVVAIGIDKDKILVSPDGVDPELFNLKENKEECRKKLNLPLDKNLIIYTGHLFVWKGVYTLAAASQFLSSQELIVFVGGMEYDREKLKKFIKDKNLRNILFVSHQPPIKMPYYLKAADVLVLPNSGKKKISVSYTSPIKMFEYMAATRPIVASDLPSIREVLNNNNSILVKPDDPSSLAEGIKKTLQNSELCGKITRQAFIEVSNYTWQKRVQNIINFIK
ncbi:MAG: glycosyltransferase family 4 protein [Patescibacteria group bacterium]|jgi:glycosyltransferase involved in cell wall biosynthesis